MNDLRTCNGQNTDGREIQAGNDRNVRGLYRCDLICSQRAFAAFIGITRRQAFALRAAGHCFGR